MDSWHIRSRHAHGHEASFALDVDAALDVDLGVNGDLGVNADRGADAAAAADDLSQNRPNEWRHLERWSCGKLQV